MCETSNEKGMAKIRNQYNQVPHPIQDTIWENDEITRTPSTQENREVCSIPDCDHKVSKGAKIRNRYIQIPHLTQNTDWKVTDSPLDTANESQEVIHSPAGDHKAHINRRAHRQAIIRQRKKNIKDPQKKYRLGSLQGKVNTA